MAKSQISIWNKKETSGLLNKGIVTIPTNTMDAFLEEHKLFVIENQLSVVNIMAHKDVQFIEDGLNSKSPMYQFPENRKSI